MEEDVAIVWKDEYYDAMHKPIWVILLSRHQRVFAYTLCMVYFAIIHTYIKILETASYIGGSVFPFRRKQTEYAKSTI